MATDSREVFLSLVASSLHRELKARKGSPPVIECPARLYARFCTEPCCTATFATYGTKPMLYQWRSHLQAMHAEDIVVLSNLCNDLRATATLEWLAQPEDQRLYVRRLPPEDQSPPQPSAAHTPLQPPEPCLPCPFACGVSHLPGNLDFTAHLVTWHLSELQTLAALQDSLVMRALKEQACPWSNYPNRPCCWHSREEAAGGTCQTTTCAATGKHEGADRAATGKAEDAPAGRDRQDPTGAGNHSPAQPQDTAGKDSQKEGGVHGSKQLVASGKTQTPPQEDFDPSPQGWWRHIHETHLADCLATTLHVFRRGEAAYESVLTKTRNRRHMPPLPCPCPKCPSTAPTPTDLIQHLLLHVHWPAAHPTLIVEDLLAHADAVSGAGQAAAAAAARELRTRPPVKAAGTVEYELLQGQVVIKDGVTMTRRPGEVIKANHTTTTFPAGADTQANTKTRTVTAKPPASPINSLRCPFPACRDHASTGAPQPARGGTQDARQSEYNSIAGFEHHLRTCHNEQLQSMAVVLSHKAYLDRTYGMFMCPVRVLQPGDCDTAAHAEYHRDAHALVAHLAAKHTPAMGVMAAFAQGLHRQATTCPVCAPWGAATLDTPQGTLDHLLQVHGVQLLKVVHCLQTLTAGVGPQLDAFNTTTKGGAGAAGGGKAGVSGQCACVLGCGCDVQLPEADGGETLKAALTLHLAEDHALQVLKLSAGAAGPAVSPQQGKLSPSDTLRSTRGSPPSPRGSTRPRSPSPMSRSMTAEEFVRSLALQSRRTAVLHSAFKSPPRSPSANPPHSPTRGTWASATSRSDGGAPVDGTGRTQGTADMSGNVHAKGDLLVDMHTRGIDGDGTGPANGSPGTGPAGVQTATMRGIGVADQLSSHDKGVQAQKISEAKLAQEYIRKAGVGSEARKNKGSEGKEQETQTDEVAPAVGPATPAGDGKHNSGASLAPGSVQAQAPPAAAAPAAPDLGSQQPGKAGGQAPVASGNPAPGRPTSPPKTAPTGTTPAPPLPAGTSVSPPSAAPPQVLPSPAIQAPPQPPATAAAPVEQHAAVPAASKPAPMVPKPAADDPHRASVEPPATPANNPRPGAADPQSPLPAPARPTSLSGTPTPAPGTAPTAPGAAPTAPARPTSLSGTPTPAPGIAPTVPGTTPTAPAISPTAPGLTVPVQPAPTASQPGTGPPATTPAPGLPSGPTAPAPQAPAAPTPATPPTSSLPLTAAATQSYGLQSYTAPATPAAPASAASAAPTAGSPASPADNANPTSTPAPPAAPPPDVRAGGTGSNIQAASVPLASSATTGPAGGMSPSTAASGTEKSPVTGATCADKPSPPPSSPTKQGFLHLPVEKATNSQSATGTDKPVTPSPTAALPATATPGKQATGAEGQQTPAAAAETRPAARASSSAGGPPASSANTSAASGVAGHQGIDPGQTSDSSAPPAGVSQPGRPMSVSGAAPRSGAVSSSGQLSVFPDDDVLMGTGPSTTMPDVSQMTEPPPPAKRP